MNKEDLTAHDEPQCEEFFDDDQYGTFRANDDQDEDRWQDFGIKEWAE